MILLAGLFLTICFLDLGLTIYGEVGFVPVFSLVTLLSGLMVVRPKRLTYNEG